MVNNLDCLHLSLAQPSVLKPHMCFPVVCGKLPRHLQLEAYVLRNTLLFLAGQELPSIKKGNQIYSLRLLYSPCWNGKVYLWFNITAVIESLFYYNLIVKTLMEEKGEYQIPTASGDMNLRSSKVSQMSGPCYAGCTSLFLQARQIRRTLISLQAQTSAEERQSWKCQHLVDDGVILNLSSFQRPRSRILVMHLHWCTHFLPCLQFCNTLTFTVGVLSPASCFKSPHLAHTHSPFSPAD